MSVLLKTSGTDTQLDRARANEAVCRRDGFLHHVLEVTSHGHATTTRHFDGFDREEITTNFRPGEPGHRANLIVMICEAVTEFPDTSIVRQVVSCDLKGGV